MDRLNPFWIHGLLAVLLGFIVVGANNAFPIVSDKLKDITGKILYWPEKPALELRSLAQAAGNWVLERKNLQEQSQELLRENLTYREILQRMGKSIPDRTSTLIPAKVTLRYPEAWWKEFRIDRGINDGIRLGAPVLSDGYLIGKISKTGDSYAWVELITSSSFLIAGVIDETWDLGVVTGDDRGNIWLLYIPEEKTINKNMRVSTALIADYIPPGIPIGKIWGKGHARDGFLSMKIVSGAHLTQLYNVQIYTAEGVKP